MAGPIALASALSRLVKIKCPWCKHAKVVARSKPASYRRCPHCHRQFPDPLKKRR